MTSYDALKGGAIGHLSDSRARRDTIDNQMKGLSKPAQSLNMPNLCSFAVSASCAELSLVLGVAIGAALHSRDGVATEGFGTRP